jgi:outer membrane protein TolC
LANLVLRDNPDLAAARMQRGVAQADVLTAGLLPDPVFSGGIAALLGGPGDASAISGGLTEDISGLITYRADLRAAKAGLAQVDAALLWQEWQTVSRAEQLCLTIAGDQDTLASLQQDQAALAAVDTATQGAVASGDLTLTDAASSQAAQADMVTAENTAAQSLQQDQNALDALLGLTPGIAVPVLPFTPPVINPALAAQLTATLPQRRPDLIALRYGYTQADARLRAAILSQFLPISIGPAGGRDTTKVFSAGPTITLTLPLFNRNRGAIAAASASRAQLAAQFQASLAGAQGDAAALQVSISVLQRQTAAADQEAAGAAGMANQATQAFRAGDLDALSTLSLTTAAATRQREAIALRAQLQTARLSLATLLGLGLPPLAPTDQDPNP